ncbi:MAG: DUF1800 domain-containing protein [Planctomycetota bacterium]
MAMNTSISAIPAEQFDQVAAWHLLNRVGYGGTPSQVNELQGLGLDAAVDRLVDYAQIDVSHLPEVELDPDVMRKLTQDERKRYQTARREGNQDVLDEQRRFNLEARRADQKMMNELRRWWFDRMTTTPRPAEDRLTLFWHGHFASSWRSVRDTYLMYRQHQMLRENANGNFSELARGIVRDPAMLKYLNNNQNNKRKPNENLARELMELFTLGVGHYTEEDIKAGARALTGYHIDDNDFIFRQGQHDSTEKTILGKQGTFDGDDFVDILLRQDSCSKFVAAKLYDAFVADVGDVYESVPAENRQVIDRIAAELEKNNFEIKPVLTKLFKSQHFYSDDIVGKKIKDPTQLTVGTIRNLGLPTRDRSLIEKGMGAMGQVLFEPPTVDGWDGGRSWINTSTLFVRQNLTTYLISNKHPAKKNNKKNLNLGYDPQSWLAQTDDKSSKAVTDFMIDHLVGPHTSAARRAPAYDFVASRETGGQMSNETLVALACLITAMPEYQLC